MKPYEMMARSQARKAWISIGKAREARAAAILVDKPWFADVLVNYSGDMASIARQYMRNAVMYRQMNEVL